MHRTNRVHHIALWSVLLGLTPGGAVLAQPPAAPAQQTPAPPVVPPIPPGEGVSQAVTPPPITVPVNGSRRLRMESKKPIKRVVNEKETVLRVQEVPTDPTAVLLTGLVPETTRLALTDVDGKEENYVVVVQFDVEYLRTILRQAVPTATVEPLPSANNVIVLSGNVARSEDVDVILKIAQSVVGGVDRVINGMQVGGVMQVQLDVVVARVSRTEARRMSFEFLNVGQQHVISNGMGGLVVPAGPLTGTFPGGPTIENTINPVNGAPLNIFLGIFSPEQDFFGFLQMLRDEQLAKILTQPKLVTLSGRPATFLSGGKVPIQSAAGFGVSSIQFERVGTSVDFLPIVLGNGKIRLEVNPQVSRLNTALGAQGNPGFDVQTVHTQVEIEPGYTLAIGGLIEQTEDGATRKVPFLGDLPFIGAAFSQKVFTATESELLILVTPHLVDPMACNQVPKCLPGQETRIPDDFELFLEGILEAPRGPREVCPNDHYVPAFRNGPTMATYPCGGSKCGVTSTYNGCGCAPAGGGIGPYTGVPVGGEPMFSTAKGMSGDSMIPLVPTAKEEIRPAAAVVPPGPLPVSVPEVRAVGGELPEFSLPPQVNPQDMQPATEPLPALSPTPDAPEGAGSEGVQAPN